MSFQGATDDVAGRLKKIVQDPWEFLKVVRTKDQVDRRNPIKAFPVEKEYLRLYVKLWQEEPKLLVPKSRRMLMSWTNISLFTWDFLFHPHREIAFVSKKEDDAVELVKRAHFIATHLDPTKIPPELVPKMEYTFGKLINLELESKIEAFPSGADQLRQFTFSGLLFDEMAFWDDAEEAYTAALPTIDGGGRIVGISSAAPGFFKKLVFDELDQGVGFDAGG